jgi:uncharacterized protein YoxC
MKRLAKLEEVVKSKVYKFNKLFNLGSISYEVETRNNSVRIYNEHESRSVNNQKELAIWVRESKKAFKNSID